MKFSVTTVALFLLVGLQLYPQSEQVTPTPMQDAQSDKNALRARILLEKRSYHLNEPMMVRGELTNISGQKLCFPEPALECAVASTGSLITTGHPEPEDGTGFFICTMCGGGKSGAELESAIRNKWIWLAPGEVYITKLAKAQLRLSKTGRWRVSAEYSPPVGSFSESYTASLRQAAKKAGCNLPASTAAESQTITVSANLSD